MQPRLVALAVVLASLALAAALWAVAAPGAAESQITVYAASSLTDVLPRIDSSPRYSFAGSNTLAAQIELGAPADVFASANLEIPRRLARRGLCSKPVVFTRNALVLIVPRSNPARIRGVRDLLRPGIKLVVAGPDVPVGDYTRRTLRGLRLSRVLSNVVSEETNVREVLAKVALGEADAGFVYSTDARAAHRRVKVLRLPARARANIRYGICIPTDSDDREDAQAFVSRVLSGAGQKKLVAAGFLVLPHKSRK